MTERKTYWLIAFFSLTLALLLCFIAWQLASEFAKQRKEAEGLKRINSSLMIAQKDLEEKHRAEIRAWRIASRPIWEIYDYELATLPQARKNFVLDGTPADLALALDPCRWPELSPANEECKLYSEGIVPSITLVVYHRVDK